MAKFSESARERELFRYEASVIAGTVPSTLGIDPIASLAQEAPFQQNPILTALAQLCAARLSAACVYISFFETQSQHVVACASPTSSLFHAGPDTDLLDLCGKAFPRNTSISEHVLQLEDIPVDDAVTQECQGQHLPISYIPDLAYHSRYSQHFFVIGKNRMRRYAAIPIKSPRGANIGVISTYSQEPGPENGDLSENASKALREASCAITEHMELVRASDGLRRTDRMVRGLGSFVEGYAGMAFSKDTNSGSSFDNVPGEGALNSRQQFLQRRATNEDETSRAFWDKMKGPTSPSQTSYFSQRPHVVSTAGSPPLSTPSVPQYMPSVTGPSTGSIITVSSETSDEDPFFAAKMTFSKAANVIRESLEVEGVLFLDASISSFGGLVSTDGRIHASRYATDMPRYSSSSDSSTDSLDERRKHEAPKLCNVFGFSTSDNSSIDCDSASPMHTAVPEKLLSALLRRHPRGKIFNFGADGSLSSGESEEEKFRNTDVEDFAPGIEGQPAGPDGSARRRASARPWSKHNEGKSVLKILSGARSVMFIPLWDANKERWYAGALVWTRSPSRFFTREGELSYLQAFNTTIMSEIMKSDALIADKAKADVLGSMSHELRSPLHGVLAAVDLFRDETVTASQADLLHSLESCGRTLLDVVNHLLDYSKVNTYLKESRDSRGDNKSIRSGSSPHPTGPHTPSRTTELDVLVEESVNSSFAGHAFQMLSIAQTSSHIHVDDADVVALRKLDTMEAMESFGHQGKSAIYHAARLGKVTVLLHIDPTVQWTFSTQSGAIRRIVLNVFGNALKYTEEGFISVALFQETAHTKNSQQAVTRLKLSVVDSGRGISPQFLQQKLFTPFAQEDRLAPGTGLGMSLVKQIVRTMSGSLTVESQVGIGTSVRISIPMKSATSAVDADANFIQQKEALRGLRISLAGLSRPIELNSKRQAMAGFTPPLPSDIMNTICAGWLQMQMVDLDDPNTRPDLILCGEDGLHEITRKGNLSALLTPTVVICADAVTAHRRSISPEYKMSGRVVEFISQPIGPRKLAKALEAALKRWIEVANSESSQSEPANRVPQTPSSTDLPLKAAQRAESGEAARQATSQGSQQQGNTAMSLSKLKENEDDEMVDQQPAEHEANKPSMGIAVVDGVNNHEKDAMDIAVLHEESEATEPPFLSANHFLLVDDNKINLQILVSFMQKLKLPYQTASHGLEAYERYIQAPGKFRCILMDLSMPIMDGLEACRRIREFERDYQLPSTKIVALTGLASVETQREAFASGMDLFYTKPVKLKDLSSAISEKRL